MQVNTLKVEKLPNLTGSQLAVDAIRTVPPEERLRSQASKRAKSGVGARMPPKPPSRDVPTKQTAEATADGADGQSKSQAGAASRTAARANMDSRES